MGRKGEGSKGINWFLDFCVCHVEGKEGIHVNFFSMGFWCKDFIQSMNVFGIWCVIGQSDYLLGIKPILSLDLLLNHLIPPFSSSIIFPLGPRSFVFFYISAKTYIFSLVTRKKTNTCLSFSQSSPLRLFVKKRKGGEFWLIINRHNGITTLEGKK